MFPLRSCCKSQGDAPSNKATRVVMRNGKKVKLTTNLETFANLLQANVGTGVLALSNAVMNVGLVPGGIGIVLIGFFVLSTMHLLLYVYKLVAINGEPLDYDDVAELSMKHCAVPIINKLARAAKWFTNFTIIMCQVATCIVYHLFCPQMIKMVVDSCTPEDTHAPLIQYQVMVTAVLLVYCVFVRSFKDMAIVSTITTIGMVACLVIIYQFVFRNLQPLENLTIVGNDIHGYFLFLGNVMFCFEITGMVLPYENEMENRNAYGGWCGVMSIAMAVDILTYAAVGVFGYLCFGTGTKVILSNVPNEPVYHVARILWVLCTVVSYNMQITIPCDILGKLAHPKTRSPIDRLLRCAMVLFTFAASAAVPCLEEIAGLAGTLCSSSVTIFIPALCLFVSALPQRRPKKPAGKEAEKSTSTLTTQQTFVPNRISTSDEGSCISSASSVSSDQDNIAALKLLEEISFPVDDYEEIKHPHSAARRAGALIGAFLLFIFGVFCTVIGSYFTIEKIIERLTSPTGCADN